MILPSILELDEFLHELDEDVEGMQATIYHLQQQLKEAKEALAIATASVPSQVADANISCLPSPTSSPPPAAIKRKLSSELEEESFTTEISSVIPLIASTVDSSIPSPKTDEITQADKEEELSTIIAANSSTTLMADTETTSNVLEGDVMKDEPSENPKEQEHTNKDSDKVPIIESSGHGLIQKELPIEKKVEADEVMPQETELDVEMA